MARTFEPSGFDRAAFEVAAGGPDTLAALALPRRLFTQPQDLVRVDRSNKFGRRLAFVSTSAQPFDFVSGKLAVVNNTMPARLRAFKGFQTTGTGKQVEFNLAPMVTSDGVGTGDFTIFVYAAPGATANPQTLYSQKNDALGAPSTQIGLYGSSTGGFGSSPGSLSLTGFSGAAFGAHSAGTALDGQPHLFMGARRNGVMFLYRDGVPLTTTVTGNQATVVWRAGQLTALGHDANSTNTPYNGILPLSGSLNYGMTDADAREFFANSWQLFQAEPRRLYFDMAAAVDPNATGSFASSLAGVTMTAAGTVRNQGPFASMLADTTMAGSGSVGAAPSGSFASTLSDTSMASSGQIIVPGAFASSLAGASMASSGTVNDRGTFASSLDGASMTAAGGVATPATGTFSSTMGGVGMVSNGFVGIPPALASVFLRRPKTPRRVIRNP